MEVTKEEFQEFREELAKGIKDLVMTNVQLATAAGSAINETFEELETRIDILEALLQDREERLTKTINFLTVIVLILLAWIIAIVMNMKCLKTTS